MAKGGSNMHKCDSIVSGGSADCGPDVIRIAVNPALGLNKRAKFAIARSSNNRVVVFRFRPNIKVSIHMVA